MGDGKETIVDYLKNTDFVDYISLLFTILILVAYIGGIIYIIYDYFNERAKRSQDDDEEEELSYEGDVSLH
ncbi:MAG: hypothetical protein H8D45_04165 [Bacteroidetes bacterium]|nr:hypothetical protein [Bacteroidota bacterium]